MDLNEYLRIFRERWIVVCAFVLLGIVAAIAVTSVIPKRYEASSSLFVQAVSPSASIYERSQFAVQQAKTYPELVSSPAVLNPVISELGLTYTPQKLAESIRAENPIDTATVVVTAEAPTPKAASDLANEVAGSLSTVVGTLEKVPATANSGASSVTLTLTTPATPPPSAAQPSLLVNLAIGVLGGLALGLITAIILSLLDRTVRSSRDLRKVGGLPLLAQLPRHGKPWRRGDDRDPYGEVVTNLQLISQGVIPAVLALTPADRSSGPTQVRRRLAGAFSASGYRVCLVEADAAARLPKFKNVGGPGVSEVLMGSADVPDALRKTGHPEIAVLTSGEVALPPGPFPGGAFAQLVSQLRRDFDCTIMQSSPLARPLDLRTVAEAADGVVILAAFGRTHADDLARRLVELQAIGVRPLGVIMTNVPSWRRVVVVDRWVEEDLVHPHVKESNLTPHVKDSNHRPAQGPTPLVRQPDGGTLVAAPRAEA